MKSDEAVQRWQVLSDETMEGIGTWREQHPKATLREIEQALDERMMKLRAKVLEDAAQMSEMREWRLSEEVPVCPDCREALEFRMKGRREMQTHGGHSIWLEREYGRCPKCGQGFFPPGR